jgi:hypothetical protein
LVASFGLAAIAYSASQYRIGERSRIFEADVGPKYQVQGRVLNPAEKPVQFMEFLMVTYAKPGSWGLDVFGGVGSAGLAAMLTDRKIVSVDIAASQVECWIPRMKQQAEKLLLNMQKPFMLDPRSLVAIETPTLPHVSLPDFKCPEDHSFLGFLPTPAYRPTMTKKDGLTVSTLPPKLPLDLTVRILVARSLLSSRVSL